MVEEKKADDESPDAEGLDRASLTRQSGSDSSSPSSSGTEEHGRASLTHADIAKFSVLIAFAVIAVIATIACWPLLMEFTTQDGIDRLTGIVYDSGPLGVGILLCCQLLQVIIAFIPGEVVQVAAGIIYGPLWGTVIVIVGAFISTVIVYAIVQKLGRPFVAKMVPQETQDKLDFITRTSRIDAIVLVLFLIPGMPKDVITYLIALTDVRPSRFFIFSTVGRIPGVVASTYIGSAFSGGNWTLLLVLIGIIVIILIVFFLMRDKIMGKFSDYADEHHGGEDKS